MSLGYLVPFVVVVQSVVHGVIDMFVLPHNSIFKGVLNLQFSFLDLQLSIEFPQFLLQVLEIFSFPVLPVNFFYFSKIFFFVPDNILHLLPFTEGVAIRLLLRE